MASDYRTATPEQDCLRVRLKILYVSQLPPSPPRFGAQARMHGLMTELARNHDLTAFVSVDQEFDIEECRRAMQAYCREVVLVRHPHAGSAKRLAQGRSLLSTQSFERFRLSSPQFQNELDRLLRSQRFDIVNLEFTFFGQYNLRQAPPGEPPPALVVDSHNIDYDIARQYAHSGPNALIRGYYRLNWPKLKREELSTYASADGVYLCSAADQSRLRAEAPTANSVVIPNGADVEFYKPDASYPAADGRTVVFFGLMSYAPNIEGVTHFVRNIWPSIKASRPDARLKIIGGSPPEPIRCLAGDGIEVTGFVPDLRPHLSSAACIVVPLLTGGGTRLKIVEGMAMGKAIVSTSLGAEGIDARDGEHILIGDDAESFAQSVVRLLDDRDLAQRLGDAARNLAVERYSWRGCARDLEAFMFKVLAKPAGAKAA